MEQPPKNTSGATEVLTTEAIVNELIAKLPPSTIIVDKSSLLKSNKQNIIPVPQNRPREKVHIQEVKTFRIDPNVLPIKQAAQTSGHNAFQSIAQAIEQMPVPYVEAECLKQPQVLINKSSVAKSTQPSLLSKQSNQPLSHSSRKLQFAKKPTSRATRKKFEMQFSSDEEYSARRKPDIYAEEQFIEFINEALYDNEELAEKQVIPLDNSDDDEPSLEEKELEYLLEMRKTNTIAVQTDESADDRINCGFINVTKNGPTKNFNLHCFYCDTEYPITFWSQFSEHVLYNHFDLEEAYFKEPEPKPLGADDTKSIATEMDVFHDLEIASIFSDDTVYDKVKVEKAAEVIKYNPKEKEILPDDFEKDYEVWEDWENESGSDVDQAYMRVDCYDPFEDHSYSSDHFNKLNKEHAKLSNPIAEINFTKTPRKIVIDFLEHLKGLPSLWHDRKHYANYNYELQALLSIMKTKWQLNYKKRYLRKNLETIKSWYASMTKLKDENAEQFQQHTFIDYYNKCAEYLKHVYTNELHTAKCDMCSTICSTSIVLQVHKYRTHKVGELPYSCNKCNKRFDYVYRLISHVKAHLQNEAKEKERKEIKEKKLFDNWVRPFLPPRPPPPPPPRQINLVCFECNQRFTCENEYKRHLDLHPKGNCPFSCDECGRRFKSIGQRTVHKKRHLPPEYQCQFCPKKFYTIFKFRMHTDGHKGIYHYICEFCGRTFLLQKDYFQHRRFKHLGDGLCKICNREYKNGFIFMRHMKTQHKPTFGTNEELSRRRPTRPKGVPCLKNRRYERVLDPITQKSLLKCPKCEKAFRRYETVLKHLRNMHNYDAPRRRRRDSTTKKLPKPYRKRVRGGKKAVDISAEEAATAVNAIQEFTNIKEENPDTDSNEPGPSNVTVGSGIKVMTDDKTGISFEKFINDIAKKHNFPFQSTSNVLGMYGQPEQEEAPLVAKIEDFDGSAFEFMLNANNPAVKLS